MKKLTSSKAFTLIEILLVSSIISLLSTVVVNESKTSRLKADDAHMKTETQQLANAVNLYKNDNNGKVPVGDTQKSAGYPIVYENNTNGTAAAYEESMQILVDEGYLPEIPTSPTGESYSYYVSEDGESAMFSAKLNFETSSSGSNSCEFVQVSSYDPQECFAATPGVFEAYLTNSDYIFFYDDWDYNVHEEILNTPGGAQAINKSEFCSAHGFSICYGDNSDEARTDLCEGFQIGLNDIENFNFNTADISNSITLAQLLPIGGGLDFPSYSGPSCGFILTSFSVLCPISEESVCDGSNNSDYCSCI
jgi:prepilin-type N-terminal cleavage/methylation domain-containing protein